MSLANAGQGGQTDVRTGGGQSSERRTAGRIAGGQANGRKSGRVVERRADGPQSGRTGEGADERMADGCTGQDDFERWYNDLHRFPPIKNDVFFCRFASGRSARTDFYSSAEKGAQM